MPSRWSDAVGPRSRTGLEAQFQKDPEVNQDKIYSLAGDLLIAAVAKATGAAVVTQNVDDFEQFDGVEVESYIR